MGPDEYIQKNRAAWNKKTLHHYNSGFYDVAGFLAGKNSLNDIELSMLGNIAGLSILHLQCHFGQDTISLGRMGAQVTGVDLSDNAIAKAKELSTLATVPAKFICCNIYDLSEHLSYQFDIVFSSYGTIMWFPDLDKWAELIARYLKPGGKFIFAEFHPVIWMFDNDFAGIAYKYDKGDPIIETETGTYADKNAAITIETITWNHGLAEVLQNLVNNGLEITSFREYDYSPYNCFQHTIEFEPGKFRIKHLADKIPMVYSLQAVKK